MKVIGIVAEFNPLHDGHKLLFDRAKKLYEDSLIIVVMSGNVVQRGEFSILNKFDRTEMALASGADIVIELPAFYTLNNSNIFAMGAINILNKFNVTDIIFGSESNDLENLNDVSNLMLLKNFDSNIKKMTKELQSYPKAFQQLIGNKFNSNDVLGLCYISAIKHTSSNIKINIIERTKELKTASMLRVEMNKKNDGLDMNKFVTHTKAHFLSLETDVPSLIYIKNKLNGSNVKTWDEMTTLLSNKSMTKSNIARLILKSIFNISLDIIDWKKMKPIYDKNRILGASESGLAYLKESSNYNTGFSPEYKVEEIISEYIDLEYSGNKKREITSPIIIFR